MTAEVELLPLPAKEHTMNGRYQAITVEVSKLSLKPGDILAIRCDRILPMEQLEAMQRALEGIAPDGVKVAVFDLGCSLTVVEPPNADGR